MLEESVNENISCPLPIQHHDKIVLGHGSGGKLTHDLIQRVFFPKLGNRILESGDDSGIIDLDSGVKLAISVDSHVVSPLFFKGGDIGRLAVCGTVNDISMSGATPLYFTAGFILEEGLDHQILTNVIESMEKAAKEAGVLMVAGDTKVVQKGKADGLYITTTGIGIVPDNVNIRGANARPGDVIILSGTIGDHGIAVLEARNELGFTSGIASDVAPLNKLVSEMLAECNELHVLRDPTRGGLATTLNEIARQSNVCILIEENRIPVKPPVMAVCEMLGYEPIYMANEGKLIAIVPEKYAAKLLETMQNNRFGSESVIIGTIIEKPQGKVLLKTQLGTTRVIDMLSGEMLPRIC